MAAGAQTLADWKNEEKTGLKRFFASRGQLSLSSLPGSPHTVLLTVQPNLKQAGNFSLVDHISSLKLGFI